MDHKQVKPKNKFLKLLPKAAAAVKFQGHQPFSPGRDHHKRSTDGGSSYTNSKLRSGTFSGPFVSIIPEEARRRPKAGTHQHEEDYVEPTSPKVSCMGQIKLKKEKVKQKHATASRNGTFKKLFRRSNSDASPGAVGGGRQPVVHDKAVVVPGLGQMKRLASGREGFKNFDWTAQIKPVESDHVAHRKGYHSDENELDSDSEDDDDGEVIIPFSAPTLIGGGGAQGILDLKPKSEVNLWKRRTMNRPRRLQLD